MAKKTTRAEAEKAVKTLISWAGDNPQREGLLETPARVTRMFEEYFSGYQTDPMKLLSRTFKEIANYDEIVILRDIHFVSHCEHHIVPFIGRAHVAYIPDKRVVGISKLARVVDAYSRRLQIQEKMTVEIGDAINKALKPKGVAVVIEAAHQCMTTRGVHKQGVNMQTSHLLGLFRSDARTRQEFFSLLGSGFHRKVID